MRFARMELNSVLPTILAAVDVDPTGSPDPGITLQPAEPIEATVGRREAA